MYFTLLALIYMWHWATLLGLVLRYFEAEVLPIIGHEGPEDE